MGLVYSTLFSLSVKVRSKEDTFSNDVCTSANEAEDVDENPAAEIQATLCKVLITFMSGTHAIALKEAKVG